MAERNIFTTSQEDLDRVRHILHKALDRDDIINVDALSALCVTAIQIAQACGVLKPHLLACISQNWEIMENGEK